MNINNFFIFRRPESIRLIVRRSRNRHTLSTSFLESNECLIDSWKDGAETKTQETPNINRFGIQMLSNSLRAQIFPNNNDFNVDEALIEKSLKHLGSFGLINTPLAPSKPICFEMPALQGNSVAEHFHSIGEHQTKAYKALLVQLVEHKIPNRPIKWILQPGWTKYFDDGTQSSVPFPSEHCFVFDVEVCAATGQIPTMACAVSDKFWYSWCSPSLCESKSVNTRDSNTLKELINFNHDGKETLIIGHNVSYDRARIRNEYLLKDSKIRFFDTMSMHIAISGITSYQRALKMTLKSRKSAAEANKLLKSSRSSPITVDGLEWNDISSLNNLVDVYKLYCGKTLDKEPRNIFLTGNISDIRTEFEALMNYCSKDVLVTHEVLLKLVPLFQRRFPHPITFHGMLEMGSTYLPINSNWNVYIAKAEESYYELELETKKILQAKAEEALSLLKDDRYKDDPWLWDLDWSLPKARSTKKPKPNAGLPSWYRKLIDKKSTTQELKLSTSMQIVPKLLRLCWFGFPLHYSRKGGWGFLISNDVFDPSSVEPTEDFFDPSITDLRVKVAEDSNSNIFPHSSWEKLYLRNKDKLLEQVVSNSGSLSSLEIMKNSMKSKGEIIVEDITDFFKGLEVIKELGLKSAKDRKKIRLKSQSSSHSPHPKCLFVPLPHKDGSQYKVGNPLAKDFLSKIEEGVLSSNDGDDAANKVVKITKMLSYWRNNKDRIMGQMTVWLPPVKSEQATRDTKKISYGAILPQVTVSGTLTRRAVEPTWLTASNAYIDRIGSELKGLIQAPLGYHIVGADVDSQELWIASVIGDAHFAGMHGCTALGWMTLQGSKSNGTDMHSKTASLIGIERDQAKILNYGRIYGAGQPFTERLLMQFNRHMSASEARNKAKSLYAATKGERCYKLNSLGRKLAESSNIFATSLNEPLSRKSILKLLRANGIHSSAFEEYVAGQQWNGGSESFMFNRLEQIAQEECPKTPVLNCSISRSLEPAVVQNEFMTSRVNWVVQSSAVDYLHLLLSNMKWMIDKYGINARLCISVHDEVRYLVKSEDRYRATLALQISNVLTRAMFAYQLGMRDLPQSVAFFSCVDVDKVLRKEVSQDCKTPSNPRGLKNEYGIPRGEAVDISSILEITKGSLLQ